MPSRVKVSPEQRRFAELLVEGELSVVDCYIDAYHQSEEQCKDRQKLASRAYMASKTKGVVESIENFKKAQAVEEARKLVWDKQKAARFLLKQCREVEVNVEFAKKLRAELMNSGLLPIKKIESLYTISKICNETTQQIKDIIVEMNKMYGLSKPENMMVAAVQVIIGNEEELPDDTVDVEVNELQ